MLRWGVVGEVEKNNLEETSAPNPHNAERYPVFAHELTSA